MPSVLVVDDEDQIRQLIRETLEQAGYDVHEASNGNQGLERYRTKPADLVIMDILMPDQDGLESIMTLRREFPASRVIAITGGSDMIGILNFRIQPARRAGHRCRWDTGSCRPPHPGADHGSRHGRGPACRRGIRGRH